MNKYKSEPFLFMQNNGGHFKVAVFARNEKHARQHIKNQANSCLIYRTLKYVENRHPVNPREWLGAKAT